MKRKIVALVLCVGILFSLTGCFNKKVLTPNEYIKEMEKLEYTTQNAKDQFAEYDYVIDVIIARDATDKYQIEFYELQDEKYAKEFLETNRKIFEKSVSGTYSKYNENLGNHSIYSLTTSDKYKLLYRVKNTALYADTDIKYKKDIENTLKKLGY